MKEFFYLLIFYIILLEDATFQKFKLHRLYFKTKLSMFSDSFDQIKAYNELFINDVNESYANINDIQNSLKESLETKYCPSIGLESLIVSTGNEKLLLPTDYEIAFNLFPNLRYAVINYLWPDHIQLGKDIIQSIVDIAMRGNYTYTEDDVIFELKKFRKTVLGLEKYRINNPGNVAVKYSSMIKACLYVNDSWSFAANALEYAGLIIKDHISVTIIQKSSTNNTTTSQGEEGIPTLNLTSLWTQTMIRLLDLDSKVLENSNVWDQKYFSQIQYTHSDIRSIQDMLTSIMRVAMRAIFSRESTHSMFILYPNDRLINNDISNISIGSTMHDLLNVFKPKEFSIRLICESEFDICNEYDEDQLQIGQTDNSRILVAMPKWTL